MASFVCRWRSIVLMICNSAHHHLIFGTEYISRIFFVTGQPMPIRAKTGSLSAEAACSARRRSVAPEASAFSLSAKTSDYLGSPRGTGPPFRGLGSPWTFPLQRQLPAMPPRFHLLIADGEQSLLSLSKASFVLPRHWP
jgi:hypothetical protein